MTIMETTTVFNDNQIKLGLVTAIVSLFFYVQNAVSKEDKIQIATRTQRMAYNWKLVWYEDFFDLQAMNYRCTLSLAKLVHLWFDNVMFQK